MEDISAIQQLYDQDGLLDILLGVEKYFDDMDLYAYKNWIYGELVEGPIVSKYWVEVTFKYDHKTFPDPMATKMFEAQGTRVYVMKTYENAPVQSPRSRTDMMTVAGQGNAVQIPKDQHFPIILYKFQIPRRIVNPESFDEYKLMSSDFNSNSPESMPDMSMESDDNVQEMDNEFGAPQDNEQQGGM